MTQTLTIKLEPTFRNLPHWVARTAGGEWYSYCLPKFAKTAGEAAYAMLHAEEIISTVQHDDGSATIVVKR